MMVWMTQTHVKKYSRWEFGEQYGLHAFFNDDDEKSNDNDLR